MYIEIIILLTVKCDFEVGFCGMKHESKFHHWQIASGFTLTRSTAPPFDHTTFSFTGRLSHMRTTVESPACPLPKAPVLFVTYQDNQKKQYLLFDLILVTFRFKPLNNVKALVLNYCSRWTYNVQLMLLEDLRFNPYLHIATGLI